MKLIHVESQSVIANDVKLATSFWQRLIGLMFVEQMKGMDALLIEPTKSVHNCFVRFAIDVVFLSKDMTIVGIVRGFKPWRFTKIYWKAQKVVELNAGTLPESVKVGDVLEVRDV